MLNHVNSCSEKFPFSVLYGISVCLADWCVACIFSVFIVFQLYFRSLNIIKCNLLLGYKSSGNCG